jgi:hypothetical protein
MAVFQEYASTRTKEVRTSGARGTRAAVYAAFFLLSAFLIAARRPDQILTPEVWNEDGTIVIKQLINEGWRGIFTPLNGYLVIPAKLITFIALKVSFVSYPFVSTILGIAAQAGVITVIAFAPSSLVAKPLCAISVVLVACDPEMFLPQYTFWWTGLLLIVALIWPAGEHKAVRACLILAAGLSSPMIIPFAALFALSSLINRSDFEIAGATLVLAIIQIAVMSRNTDPIILEISIKSLRLTVAKMFGAPSHLLPYAGYWSTGYGLFKLSLLGSGIFLLKGNERLSYSLLLSACIATVALSLARAPIEVVHQILAAPRYFFYPFILTSWLLIWLVFRASSAAVRVSAVVVLLLPLLDVYSHFQHQQTPIEPWSKQVSQCLIAGKTFSIQYNGEPERAWQMLYSKEECHSAMVQSLFDR